MTALLFFLAALVLLFLHVSAGVSLAALIVATFTGLYFDDWQLFSVLCALVLLACSGLLLVPNSLRSSHISRPLLAWIRGRLPELSDTEMEALNSGSVDWDGELFSGRPNWNHLLSTEATRLSQEERAFIDGPVETLCGMVDDWRITSEHYDLPQEVWDFIREQGFFGLVIPREHGGKGFSATAHSEIVMKLSTRSVTAAVTVMVPNSLGPGELLLHYGTDSQRDHYLPRLSRGEDIPCFALTSPVAGSDAGAIPDKGIVCRGQWQGEEVLGLRVTWNKRYITLAPVATVIGLAIKVYDPDLLVGDHENVGITCVLVPADLAGVNSGSRHLPMNAVFMNGPTWGEEVFIPMDQVIGGQDMLGKGWSMLLECLSIGRSISLPAMGAGAGKLASLSAGSYACIREQFGRSISQFEGVQEALEPIAGYTYMMDAARLMTASMLDRGVRPSVPSAVLKYRNTDLMRTVINHAMDIVAGRGVISGPRNFMARVYQAIPIAITVEGANILTRSLMIFGQGAIRCHPYIVAEMDAAGIDDETKAVEQFDAVFYHHLAHTATNLTRALVLALSGSWLAPGCPKEGQISHHFRRLSRFAAAFALLTDVSLLSIGGGLKARQRFSGRMADCLTHLYYASATIKQWQQDDYPESDRCLVEWGLQTSLYGLQESLRAVIDNFPVGKLVWPLRLLIFPLGSGWLRKPDDQLGAVVAASIVTDGATRERVCRGMYRSTDEDDALGQLEKTYNLMNASKELRATLNEALRRQEPDDIDGVVLLMGHKRRQLVDWAITEKLVNEEEGELLFEALTAQYQAIRVDAFDAQAISELAQVIQGKYRETDRP